MHVHCDAVMHCDPWHCFSLSVPPPPPPPSSLLFSQEYKQNYRAFKIQNVPESRKE